MKQKRLRKRQKLIHTEVEELPLIDKDIREVLAYIFRWEPIILGWALADVARYRGNLKAYRWVGKLLQLAMLPPMYVPDDLLNASLEAIVKVLPKEELTSVINFMAGYLAEHQPIPTWEVLIPTWENMEINKFLRRIGSEKNLIKSNG